MMRGGIIWCSIIIVFAFTNAKAADKGIPNVGINDVELLLADLSINSNLQALDKLSSSLEVLRKKHSQYKREKDFVEHLYYYTHRKILKSYNQYASLSETLTTGAYDCLTATAVYSIFLKELSIPHEVVETNYHIYILVYPDTEEEILIETTDPHSGFITDKEQIESLKEKYRHANSELNDGQADMNLDIEHKLDGKELIGLLYYNQSVKELNTGSWRKAEELANKALTYYPTMRIQKLIQFIDTSFKSASL